MKFKLFIKEALDKPVPFKWTVRKADHWEGEFFIQAPEIAGVPKEGMKYIFVATQEAGVWDVAFSNKYRGGVEITGTGHQFQVFATVLKMCDVWIRSVKPEEISFSIFEAPTRAKLYKRFAKMAAKKYGYESEPHTSSIGYGEFYLYKESLKEEKWKWGKDKPSSNTRRFYFDYAKNKKGMLEIRYMSAVGPRANVEKWTGRVFDSPEKAQKVVAKLNKTANTDRQRKARVPV
jgi:hypothetical protein